MMMRRPAAFMTGKGTFMRGLADTNRTSSPQMFRAVEEGVGGTHDWRCFIERDGARVSPWHHIPTSDDTTLIENSTLNFVCEIPKGTTAKMEIDTSTSLNPIVQDTKKDGSLRHYMTGPMAHNYGALHRRGRTQTRTTATTTRWISSRFQGKCCSVEMSTRCVLLGPFVCSTKERWIGSC